MPGREINAALTTIGILKTAAERHPEQEVVSILPDDSVHRFCYRDTLARVCQLGHALKKLKLADGKHIATLAANHHRHLELVYAAGGLGSVIHPLNAHLFDKQLLYIIQHAQDSCIFADPIYLPQLERLADQLASVKTIVVLCEASQMPTSEVLDIRCYEQLISQEPEQLQWPELSEHAACGLCYTSGTTGNPKGVMHEHVAIVDHAQTIGRAGYFGFTPDSVVMPIVPFCYAYSWGVPFAAMLQGATLVLPGCALLSENVQGLIETELVTHAFAAPDVWRKLHGFLMRTGLSIDSLAMIGAGGDPSPQNLVKLYAESYQVYWMGLWGMTETSPLLTASTQTTCSSELPVEERYARQASAGLPIEGVEIEIFDALGRTHRMMVKPAVIYACGVGGCCRPTIETNRQAVLLMAGLIPVMLVLLMRKVI